MRTNHTFIDLLIRSVMAVLLGIGLALLLNTKSVAGDIKLDEIKTRTDSYKNVTVTGHNKTDIFITHSQGMANLKIKDLDPETLWRVGLGPQPTPSEALGSAQATQDAGEMPAALAKMLGTTATAGNTGTEQETSRAAAVAGTLSHQLSDMRNSIDLDQVRAGLQSNVPILGAVIGAMLLFYLFYCYCLKLIVEKTGNKAGFKIWVPILNWCPALRAANMSEWWLGFPLLTIFLTFGAGIALLKTQGPSPVLFALVIPYLIACLVLFIGQIMWCVKIVQARGKSGWLSTFMILWLLSPLATPLGLVSETFLAIYNLATFVLAVFSFLYLAFSGSAGTGYAKEEDDDKIMVQSAFSEA